MATNQDQLHASFRTIAGGTGTYEEDAIKAMLFEDADSDGTTYDEILISWLQFRTSSSLTNINDLKQKFAEDLGVDSWESITSFSKSTLVPFQFSVLTTNAGSPSTDFVVPTVNGGTYDCTVDWGDGNSDTITTWNDAAWTHSYSSGGSYTIKITGTFTGLSFANAGDKAKIINIDKWGPLKFTASDYAFWGCSNLTVTAEDILDVTGLNFAVFLFRGTAITTIPSLNSWDFSGANAWNAVFQDCPNFSQDIDLDLSSCISIVSFIRGCAVFDGSITLVTTSNTNLFAFLNSCPAMSKAVSMTSTKNVTGWVGAFSNLPAWNRDDISSMDFSAATDCIAILDGTTLSQEYYENIWNNAIGPKTLQSGVTWTADNSLPLGDAATARYNAINDDSWSVADGGFDISGLQLWLDAADTSTIAESLDAVSQWDDKSGNSRNVVQATGGFQPLTNTNTINGKNVIKFDGSDDNLKYGTTDLNYDSHTIFVVAKSTATGNDIYGSGGVVAGDVLLMDFGSKFRGHFWTDSAPNTIDSVLATNSSPTTYIQTVDASNITIIREFTQDNTASLTGSKTSTNKDVVIGNRSGAAAGTFFTGDIAEVIVFNAALTDDERTRVTKYLQGKWNT